MAEQLFLATADEDEAQQDWIGPALKLESYRQSLRSAVKRITPKELAHLLRIDADSLGQQLRRWDKRKHPSADCAFFAQDLDAQHAAEVAGLSGRLLTKPPKMSAEDAIRIASERASSKGFVSAAEMASLLAQTDFGRKGR